MSVGENDWASSFGSKYDLRAVIQVCESKKAPVEGGCIGCLFFTQREQISLFGACAVAKSKAPDPFGIIAGALVRECMGPVSGFSDLLKDFHLFAAGSGTG